MAATIYAYSGTGNSLHAARRIAGFLPDAAIVSLPTGADAVAAAAANGGHETVGLVFPVHIWGLPAPVAGFLDLLAAHPPGYLFAVATNAGELGGALLRLERALGVRGMGLSAGWGLEMPSNYAPWGGPGPDEAVRAVLAAADRKLESIAAVAAARGVGAVDRGLFKDRLKTALVHGMAMRQVPRMDASFRADARCDGCGICARACPAGNIVLVGGRPAWNHRCHQCLACLQWCPPGAISFGKSARYPRYHHPDVSLKDILTARKGPGRGAIPSGDPGPVR